MPRLLNISRLATALVLALQAGILQALPEDQQQPIHVTANSAVQENNTVTYRGNVVIVQGSVRIEADQVVIYHEKGKLLKATATGKPARFQQQPEADGGLITGSASTLIYHNSDQRVELLQDAFVDRDKSTVKSDRIEYLLPSKTVRAETTPSNAAGRVEMVLQPNQAKPVEKPEALKPEVSTPSAPQTQSLPPSQTQQQSPSQIQQQIQQQSQPEQTPAQPTPTSPVSGKP